MEGLCAQYEKTKAELFSGEDNQNGGGPGQPAGTHSTPPATAATTSTSTGPAAPAATAATTSPATGPAAPAATAATPTPMSATGGAASGQSGGGPSGGSTGHSDEFDRFGWHDEKTQRAKSLLERFLNDAHWKYSQRYQMRRMQESGSTKIAITGIIVALGFLFYLWYTSRIEDANLFARSYSGVLIALLAGLLGASFSLIIASDAHRLAGSIEEQRQLSGGAVRYLRLVLGGMAAVILYFLFQSQLIDGLLFPDLEKLGFAPIDQGGLTGAQTQIFLTQISDLVKDAKEQSAAMATKLAEVNGGAAALINDTTARLEKIVNALEQLADRDGIPPQNLAGQISVLAEDGHDSLKAMASGAGSLGTEATDQIKALQEKLTEIADKAAGGGKKALGLYVPNAELSKLFVWSIIAGFSEQLVVRMLRGVDKDAEQRAAAAKPPKNQGSVTDDAN